RYKDFGSALHIQLDDKLPANTEFNLVINYTTLKQGVAVQWLEPIQTAGKKYPYLFTHCHPVNLQKFISHISHISHSFPYHTPAIKLSYNAIIQVPQPLRALMSAIEVCEELNLEANTKIYKFKQTVKIPSYLIALAIGNLVGEKIGPRSTVWSEPEV
ncbi:4987_t:CDS:2, partial [Scutellospora calospora]